MQEAVSPVSDSYMTCTLYVAMVNHWSGTVLETAQEEIAYFC